jgi:phospholipid/cholesterol/gamma-HCH transport system substrate-binding protein
MLTRTVYVKLILFVLITVVGVSYVSVNYIGVSLSFGGGGACTIKADFPDSGGIFTNAEVTERGVAIGRVGQLSLLDDGVQVALKIDDCGTAKIPVGTTATVSDRSVIGEQYVNLITPARKGQYMRGGEVIPMSKNSIPIAAEVLLTNLDTLAKSVDTTKLASVISELGKAFNNKGADLATLLDSTNNLLSAATDALPQTIQLIGTADKVLQTQLDLQPSLQSFTHSLNLITQQLKTSDPDIRHLFSTGPSDLDVVKSFVDDNKTDLGVALADLASTGQVLSRHIDGIEQILELYPALAAGGKSVIQPDGVGALALVVNTNDPPDCGDPTKGSEGYEGTTIRRPNDTSPQAPNVDAHCTAPTSSGTNIRGSANVPGGDPISATGGSVAYPRADTSNTVGTSTTGNTATTATVGTSLNSAGVLADESWVAILTDSLN